MSTVSGAAATITVPDDGMLIIPDDSLLRDGGHAELDADLFRIRVHPLEAIRLNNEGHPITELHAACAYIVERAHADLDTLADRLRDDMETPRNCTARHTSTALAAGPSVRSSTR